MHHGSCTDGISKFHVPASLPKRICPRWNCGGSGKKLLFPAIEIPSSGLQPVALPTEMFRLILFLWILKFNKSNIQGDSFGTRPKKMRISQRIIIRFWTCIYDYIPFFMGNMLIIDEMLEMFVTTVQTELNAKLRVRQSGLQDVLTNRSNFTSNVVFQLVYDAWLVGISFSF